MAFHIHATKKLFAALPLSEHGFLPANDRFEAHPEKPESPLTHWHANLLTLQRKNCLLFMHDKTRFPLFIPNLGKKELASVEILFEETLMNTLLKIGAEHHHIEQAFSLMAPLQFDTQTNRSLQGTMNRMKQQIEHLIHFDGLKIAEVSGSFVSTWQAEMICSVKKDSSNPKDWIVPKDAMLELLNNN